MPEDTTDRESEEPEEVLEGASAPEEAPVLEEAPAPAPPRELCAEVASKFEEKKDCAGLLYAPLGAALTYRKTHVYRFKFMGSASALRNFIRKVLVDRVSQEVAMDAEPVLGDFRFYLDYGMKKGVLDHEKESVLHYHGEVDEPGFEILDLELSTRIYVFGKGGPGKEEEVSAPFVRDIVNPAIHRWSINDERSIA